MVVYHGTGGDFEAFNKEYQNEATGFGDFGKGFYLSSIYDGSRYYTIGKDNSYILKVYLKVENPFVFDLISEKLDENTKERLLSLNVDIPIKHIIQDVVNKNEPFAYRELGKTISDETLSQIFIDNGYDGVFVNRSFITNDGTGDKLEKRNLYEIVVYEPNQIKSAIGNSGEFDPNNPSIIMAEGGYIPYKYRSRFRVPNVRGGWTENKIIRHLKEIQSSPSFNTYGLSNFISTVFPTVEDFKKNIYYHGTANPINGLKPSITFSERQAERMGGGGYGERYWGISLTKRKKTAESFSGQSSSVSIYPVILKPDAKVIIREDLQDASEIEDIIVDLWNQGVDAIWIGGGEEELVVINPYAIVVYKKPERHQVFGGFKSVQPTDEEIEHTFNEAKEIYKKTKEKLDNASNIEDRQERIDTKNEITRSLEKLKFKEGGQVCTYDFDGYDLAKMKCGNNVDVYLIPAEYDRVSIFLFENHFPLWLYYNYLARIVISKEDVFTFKKQCLEEFKIDKSVKLLVKPFDDKYWKKTPFGKPRSYMGYSETKGIIQKLEIVLVQNGSWANKFKERTSGLTLPNPKGVHLNTVIHEFAHLIDVVRYNDKNPNEKIIVTHQRGFLVALVDVLIACKRNEIPIVNMVDNKALIIQKALQKPSFVERYKDTYGLNVFDGSVPKDLKEYDERFASLKGSKLNKEQAKELFNLIKKYQDEVLMGMAMINPNKANRLFKSTNDLLTELKKYS